jgi:hypothetical protein
MIILIKNSLKPKLNNIMSANRKKISTIFIDEKDSPKTLNFTNVIAKIGK